MKHRKIVENGHLLSGHVPYVDSAQNNKIAKVVNGEWNNGTDSGDVLPAVTTSDNGDVLTVVEGSWAKAAPATELPAVSSTDNGDVLTVVEGSWAKAAPSGGDSLPEVTAADNGDVLTVVSGAWAKAAPNILMGHLTNYDEQSETQFTDLKYSDIDNTITNGGMVFLNDDGWIWLLVDYEVFDLTYKAYFYRVNPEDLSSNSVKTLSSASANGLLGYPD